MAIDRCQWIKSLNANLSVNKFDNALYRGVQGPKTGNDCPSFLLISYRTSVFIVHNLLDEVATKYKVNRAGFGFVLLFVNFSQVSRCRYCCTANLHDMLVWFIIFVKIPLGFRTEISVTQFECYRTNVLPREATAKRDILWQFRLSVSLSHGCLLTVSKWLNRIVRLLHCLVALLPPPL